MTFTPLAPQPPREALSADVVFDASAQINFDGHAPKYYYNICGHQLHVKTAGVIAVAVSFLSCVASNLFLIIGLHSLIGYFVLAVGCLVFVGFLFGYYRHMQWLILIYMDCLGIFVIDLAITLLFGIWSICMPGASPVLNNEGSPMLYITIVAVSGVFIVLNILCIFVIHRLYRFFCDRKDAPHSSNPHFETLNDCRDSHNVHHNFLANIIRGSRRRGSSDAPICVISYPPPCPPAYEAEITPVNSPSPPRRPRHKHHRRSPPRAVLPQYTDFRPDVYAEPPPYEDKPEIQNYI